MPLSLHEILFKSISKVKVEIIPLSLRRRPDREGNGKINMKERKKQKQMAQNVIMIRERANR